MATLYVENVPDDLYDALRDRARDSRRSIAAEIISLLEENVPTENELRARRRILQQLAKLNSAKQPAKSFPATEEMQRQDRAR